MYVLVKYWLWSWKGGPKISEWLGLKNGCADFIHPWVVDTTQLESTRSVIN